MCSICLHSPCTDGCPNKPEKRTGKRCGYCHEPIQVGEEYAESDYTGSSYHTDCIEMMTIDELAITFGFKIRDAEEDKE